MISRRNLLKSAAIAGVMYTPGCLGDGYDVEDVKKEAEPLDYAEVISDIEAHKGERIKIERGELTILREDNRGRIHTRQEDGEWVDDVFFELQQEQTNAEQGDIVEAWGVIEGEITSGGENIPRVVIVEMNPVE